jgi:type 1 glutamine amidotransferase
VRRTLAMLMVAAVILGIGISEPVSAQLILQQSEKRIGGHRKYTRSMLHGPVRIHLISGSDEYDSQASLEALQQHLESKYRVRCSRSFGTDATKPLPHLGQAQQAHVVVVFCSRYTLTPPQLEMLRGYCDLGATVSNGTIARFHNGFTQQQMVAIHALAAENSNRAARILLQHVHDKNESVAHASIAALGKIGRTEDVKLFKELAVDDRPTIGKAAVTALGAYGRTHTDHDFLVKVFDTDKSPQVRGEIARILGRHYYWKAMPTLVRGLNDPALEVRSGCALAVERLMGTRFPYRPDQSAGQRAREAAKIQKIYPRFKQANIDWLPRLDTLDKQEATAFAHGIVAIRTGGHAFSNWPDFDDDVLGGQYRGHYGDEPIKVLFDPKFSTHPILKLVGPFTSRKLYKTGKLSADTFVLATGSNGMGQQNVAWARESKGLRVFTTSLGVAQDFKNSNFIAMVTNAIFHTARRDPSTMTRMEQ